MRALVLFACLSAACLAQRPQPCTSPPLLTGSLYVTSRSQKLTALARYTYDALQQRVRFTEFGAFKNETFQLDVLLLYRERVVYIINNQNQTCSKKPLNALFHPLAIPPDANRLAQVVVGSSSDSRQGVLVNTWFGELQLKTEKAKYIATVTDFGCIPISTLFYTTAGGWVVNNYFNNVLGIVNPERLIPPSFCRDMPLEKLEEPVIFFDLF